jgi:hypothetical protein
MRRENAGDLSRAAERVEEDESQPWKSRCISIREGVITKMPLNNILGVKILETVGDDLVYFFQFYFGSWKKL